MKLRASLLGALLALPAFTSAAPAPQLATRVTEEGQTVAFDRYTWDRRELAKRLPLGEPWPATDEEVAKAVTKWVPATVKAPEFITSPARILTDVYLVNNEPNHTYLIDAGKDGLVLVDPGLSMNADSIRAKITQLGFSPKNVRWVINTHAHFDHSMADAEFRKGGAQILIGEADASAVEKGTEVTQLVLFFPGQDFPATTVDRRLSDGETLKLGNKVFHVIHTPGHTPGSSNFYLQVDGRNVLFSGDTLLYDNRLAFQGHSYANPRQYVESLKKLNDFRIDFRVPLRWDVLLPGHGAIVMDRAYMDVEKGLRTAQIDSLEGMPVEALPFATAMYRRIMFGRP